MYVDLNQSVILGDLEVVPCGLVQHQYGGVLNEGPGYGDSLFLSPRDGDPSLTQDGIVPLRKRPDKAISISHRGSLNHLIQYRNSQYNE